MTEQPTALRLADALDVRGFLGTTASQAAAELRRQHALLQEWKAKAATWLASPEAAQRLDGYRELSQRANRAEAQRDALLEALKGITPPMPPADAPCHVGLVPQEKCAHCGRIARARAAIKAVEEGK